MKRKCDHCDQEATVHEVVIKNGEKVEKHLCEVHASEEGIAVQSHAPINELITKFAMSMGGQGARKAEDPSCESCGRTWTEFRQHALLGCAHCYTTFEEQLGAVVEQNHSGATHHVGKTPSGSEGLVDREHKIASLRRELNDAVAAEEYERAASLRDELLQAQRPGARSSSPAPAESSGAQQPGGYHEAD